MIVISIIIIIIVGVFVCARACVCVIHKNLVKNKFYNYCTKFLHNVQMLCHFTSLGLPIHNGKWKIRRKKLSSEVGQLSMIQTSKGTHWVVYFTGGHLTTSKTAKWVKKKKRERMRHISLTEELFQLLVTGTGNFPKTENRFMFALRLIYLHLSKGFVLVQRNGCTAWSNVK